MEALSLWVPVFGYNQGGTAELVDEKFGLLTDSKELSHLIWSFETFKEKQFDRLQIKQNFLKKILS